MYFQTVKAHLLSKEDIVIECTLLNFCIFSSCSSLPLVEIKALFVDTPKLFGNCGKKVTELILMLAQDLGNIYKIWRFLWIVLGIISEHSWFPLAETKEFVSWGDLF